MSQDFASDFIPVLINRPSDLMDRFGFLFAFSGSSPCDPPVLFDRILSPPVLSDLGILVVTGVHIDVSGPVMYLGLIQCGPVRVWRCQMTSVMGTGCL